LALDVFILAIESSCDDTSVAVLKNDAVLSNTTANQLLHKQLGGVVPEIASREHQKNIIDVCTLALQQANVSYSQLNAIAVTAGPGLMGSLLVGVSFAKALAYGLGIPLIAVNHIQAHVLCHLIKTNKNGTQNTIPLFPYLCLTVSGGHTQLVVCKSAMQLEIIGQSLDDAAGEAFDKAAKILGLEYPGGPLIDKFAQLGNNKKYNFPKAKIANYDFSFSGTKTAFLNFIENNKAKDSLFIKENLHDICASFQYNIVETLVDKMILAAKDLNIKTIALAGGVSANSLLRSMAEQKCGAHSYKLHIPSFEYCTDNAAMIGIVAYYKFLKGDFANLELTAFSS
jgi:N6-L-threonylcarbamoyladenine synthase